MMEKEQLYQIIDASVSAAKIGIDIGRQQFASDLKARLEVYKDALLSKKLICEIIDETLNNQ